MKTLPTTIYYIDDIFHAYIQHISYTCIDYYFFFDLGTGIYLVILSLKYVLHATDFMENTFKKFFS